MTQADYASRVQRGAALLDEKVPGWREKIDLDKLDLSCPARCVLGQLRGELDAANFTDVADALLPEAVTSARSMDYALRRYGFEIDSMVGDMYEELGAEWRRQLGATR